MSGRRGWREPVLALTGVALAIASAGIGVAVVDRVRDQDRLIAYSIDRGPSPAQSSEASPEPTGTPADAATATVESTTVDPSPTPTRRPATPTPQPSRTRTPTPQTTPTRTPTPQPTATPTARPAGGLALEQSSFALPADATANGGATIGPFCCRGRTVTLRSAAGETIGYAYWYQWSGTAYALPRGGGVEGGYPDIQILLNDVASGASQISFSASEIVPGATRSLDFGRFRFTVTITAAELTTYAGATYVWESSLAATLQVEAR